MRARTLLTSAGLGLVPGLVLAPPAQSQVSLYSRHGLQPGAEIGRAIAPAGDVDGDGATDIVIGVPRYDGVAGQDSGLVLVLSGLDGRELRRLEGAAAGEKFGAAVAAGLDLDGDGTPDLAVGAPENGSAGPAAGRVEAFSGATGASLGQRFGNVQYGFFGASVALVGDVNGDGLDDLAVAAPYEDGAGTDSGRVDLLRGPSLNLLWSVDGNQTRDRLGAALAALGDVDGDGRPDLVAGAPGAPGAPGYALVLSGASGLPVRTHVGAPGDALGSAVAAAGDVDGDGVDDVAVGAPFADGIFTDAGRATVYSGANGAPILSLGGESPGGRLGMSVAGGGDVNGDGRVDLLVGAPGAGSSGEGRARVFSGANGAPLWIVAGREAGDALGACVALLGDIDGSGRVELAIGSPAADFRAPSGGLVRVFGDLTPGPQRYCASSMNSTGQEAAIGWLGTPSVASNDLELTCFGLPTNAPVVFFYGRGRLSLPLGQGQLCIDPNAQGTLHRLPVVGSGAGGFAVLELVPRHPRIAEARILPGSTWSFQAWYRDAAWADFNLSDAFELVFVP